MKKIAFLFLLVPVLFKAQVLHKRHYFFHAPIQIIEAKATQYFNSANYTAAIPVYFNALFLSELEKNDATTSVLAHHLATCYSYLGDLSAAHFFANKSLRIAEKSTFQNKKLTSELYNLLGSITTNPTKYQQAKQYFERALEIQKSVGDQREIGNIYLNFGCLEMESQHFDRAEELFQTAQSNFEQINDKRGVAMAFLNSAILLVNRSEIEPVNWLKGIELSNATQTIIHQLDAEDIQVRVFELKSLFFKQLNQLDSSLFYAEKFHSLKDELYNISQMRKLNNLKSSYQLQKKQLEIQRLTLDKKRAEQHATNWKIGVLFILVLSLFAYLIFRNRRMVQVLYQQRKEQEQELRFLQAQMNPHFLFNTLTSAQSMVVRGNKIEAADFLGDFSKLVRLGLDLNHQEKISLSDEIQFLKKLIEMEMLRNSLSINFVLNGNFIDIEDEVFIAPMLLQPFVENALIHGLPFVESPFLLITIDGLEKELRVTITNNFNPKRASSINRKSRGIEITKKRVELLNSHDKPNRYKVEIHSKNEIFNVQLILPLQFTP
ncbi:MAG: hypothetical protein RL264_485 [Bacteroidota bacterium]